MRKPSGLVLKELTAVWEATFGEQLSNESLGNPRPQGQTRFLTKSEIDASRLAASSAPEALAGRRLRRTRAKVAKTTSVVSGDSARIFA